MFEVYVKDVNGGSSRSIVATLDSAVCYAWSMAGSKIGSCKVKSVEVRERRGNKWVLLAI